MTKTDDQRGRHDAGREEKLDLAARSTVSSLFDIYHGSLPSRRMTPPLHLSGLAAEST